MSEKTGKTIRIKWVRSGIGFTYRQKSIVRSLGLNKLNHTVVRPDTPQIRGIVASVPHLLEIVAEPVAPAWASIPEYIVIPAAPEAPAKKTRAKRAPKAAAAKEEKPVEAAAEAPEAVEAKPAKPRRRKKADAEGEASKTGEE